MDSRLSVCVLIVAFIGLSNAGRYPLPREDVNKDWIQQGQDEIHKALGIRYNTNVAKNVVLFLGDGMGLITIWASRIYTGQTTMGQSGEEYEMGFEKFDHVGLAKTYNTDYQIPDSAGTGTAYLTGVKTRKGTLGVNENVMRGDCSNQEENKLQSIVDWSLAAGKSVGVLTTARLTHATPAASYAHSASRNWESDTDFLDPSKGDPDYNSQFGCKDIARQLIEDNPDIHVILGGGRSKFLPKETRDPEYPEQSGDRSDGRNLIQEWIDRKEEEGRSHAYVWNKEQLDSVKAEDTDYLLGIFEPSHMQYELDKNKTAEPTFAELTEKAIEILQKNEKGYFLLAEGGRIDLAHHFGLTQKALDETRALNDAVKRAQSITDEEDTLLVVTADHSHSFVTQGYPGRGNPILGLVDNLSDAPPLDNLPYMTLAYSNGPGALLDGGRVNLTGVDTEDKNFMPEAHIPLFVETHGGEDVPVYAHGPMAHLFHGVHEQNYVAHVMGYASCVGPNGKHCNSVMFNSAGYCRFSVLNVLIMFVIIHVV